MEIRPAMKNKKLGIAVLFMGLLVLASILYKFFAYRYEYSAQFRPVDYGRIQYIMYFTVQSNLFAAVYLIILALAIFGVAKAQKIAFNRTLATFVTTYIIIAGVVYCSGIFMGMTEPSRFDTLYHAVSSLNQVLHHMIMPPFMTVLYFLPAYYKKIPLSKAWAVGIYPLVYSIFSMVRGELTNPHFYPYPFYHPDFFWNIFFKDRELDLFKAYLLMIPALFVGIMIFILTAMLLIKLNNNLVNRKAADTDE